MKPDSSPPDSPAALRGRVRRSARHLPPPASYYFGLAFENARAPDNIVIFHRSEPKIFTLEGAGYNYHHRFELVAVLESAGAARIDDFACRLKPGECALVFPNQFHRYLEIAADRMDWLFITFELADASELESLRNSPRVLDPDALQLLNALVKTCSASSPDALDAICGLRCLLNRLPTLPAISRPQGANDTAGDVIVEKISRCVRKRLAEAPSISAIAEDLGYSVSHLRAVFRERLGVSLGRYIRETRLSEAAKLLQKSDRNISEVAAATGFESLFAFSRAFKRTYSFAPKAYRRLMLQRPGPSTDPKGIPTPRKG